jgi:hypothetical protein
LQEEYTDKDCFPLPESEDKKINFQNKKKDTEQDCCHSGKLEGRYYPKITYSHLQIIFLYKNTSID